MVKKVLFLLFILMGTLLPGLAQKSNVVFIVADDAGHDKSAYYRKWENTPAFFQIAKEGILFQNAFAPNAKCAPFRACILTDRNPWQLDALYISNRKIALFLEELNKEATTIILYHKLPQNEFDNVKI